MMSVSTSGQVYVEGAVKKVPRGLVVDEFYRYKMPPVEVRTTKHATWILNAREIGEALEVNPEWIAKFASVTLGTRASYQQSGKSNKKTKKKQSSEQGIKIYAGRNGSAGGAASEVSRCQDLVYRFIDAYVLCTDDDCVNPEFSLSATSDGRLRSVCPACGAEGYVGDTKSLSKVTGFIVKDLVNRKKAAKKEKKARQTHKGDGRKAGGDKGSKRHSKDKGYVKKGGKGRAGGAAGGTFKGVAVPGLGAFGNDDEVDDLAAFMAASRVATGAGGAAGATATSAGDADGDDDESWASDSSDSSDEDGAAAKSKFFA